VTCGVFIRDDGLLEVEGLLIDTKPEPIRLLSGWRQPGEPIHQIRARIVADGERRIVEVHAYSEHHPYPECAQVEAAYRALIGLKVEPGFTREVKPLFRGVKGCSQLTEVIPLMASAIFQAEWASSDFGSADAAGRAQRTSPLGGCHAVRMDGEIVRVHFPHLIEERAP
jgi:hypothetical protein